MTTVDTINFSSYATAGQRELANAINASIDAGQSIQSSLNRMLGDILNAYAGQAAIDRFAKEIVETWAAQGYSPALAESFNNSKIRITRAITKMMKIDVTMKSVYQLPKASDKGVKPPSFAVQHEMIVGEMAAPWRIGVQLAPKVTKVSDDDDSHDDAQATPSDLLESEKSKRAADALASEQRARAETQQRIEEHEAMEARIRKSFENDLANAETNAHRLALDRDRHANRADRERARAVRLLLALRAERKANRALRAEVDALKAAKPSKRTARA